MRFFKKLTEDCFLVLHRCSASSSLELELNPGGGLGGGALEETRRYLDLDPEYGSLWGEYSRDPWKSEETVVSAGPS
jgi:hypothetical protein